MKTMFVLLGILFVASYLRLYHLGGVPVSLNWDEAALGYNAYSILHTGKDEYGSVFPLILRSFGNYTPALYAYLAIPGIFLFDLSQFSVRLPSAIMGVLAVLGTFFLAKEIAILAIPSKRTVNRIALLSTFFMSISPWHLQFSRVAYEASVTLPFWIWGLFCLCMGVRKPAWYVGAAVLFGIALHGYHTPRLLIPLFLIGFFMIMRKQLLLQKKQVLFAGGVGLLFLLPFILLVVSHNSEQITARFAATTILSSHNKSISETAYEIANGYFSHFSLRWMFVTGDNDRHHAPSTGLLYLWELPFLLLGLSALFSLKGWIKQVLLWWLFVVPIPASFTSEVPHAVRSLFWLPLPFILIAMGIDRIRNMMNSVPVLIKRVVIGVWGVILIFSFFQYFYLYHTHLNLEASRFWQFGYEHAVNFTVQNKDRYKKIYVSHALEQPYIFFLFYTKYDPRLYLAQGGTKGYTRQSFDRFVFETIDWSKKKERKGSLYLLDAQEQYVSPVDTVIHTIRYFDGSQAMVFIE